MEEFFRGWGTLWDTYLLVSLTNWDTPVLYTPPLPLFLCRYTICFGFACGGSWRSGALVWAYLACCAQGTKLPLLLQELSAPVLRDTARLSQRYPPSVSQHGQWGAIPLPLFWVFPPWRACEVEVRYPPPSKGVSRRYLRDTTGKQGKWVRHSPLRCYLERVLQGIWGGISHWAAKYKRLWTTMLGGSSDGSLSCPPLCGWVRLDQKGFHHLTLGNPLTIYRVLSGPLGPKHEKVWKKSPHASGPGSPRESGKSLEKVWRVWKKSTKGRERPFRDFFETLQTSRGRRHLSDFFRHFQSFSGFRAQRARDTPLNGQRVPNLTPKNIPNLQNQKCKAKSRSGASQLHSLLWLALSYPSFISPPPIHASSHWSLRFEAWLACYRMGNGPGGSQNRRKMAGQPKLGDFWLSGPFPGHFSAILRPPREMAAGHFAGHFSGPVSHSVAGQPSLKLRQVSEEWFCWGDVLTFSGMLTPYIAEKEGVKCLAQHQDLKSHGQDFPEELQSLPNRTYPSGPDQLRTPPPRTWFGPDFDLILTIRTWKPPFQVQIRSGGGGVRRGSGLVEKVQLGRLCSSSGKSWSRGVENVRKQGHQQGARKSLLRTPSKNTSQPSALQNQLQDTL